MPGNCKASEEKWQTKKFRKDFQTEPQIVQKYVACAIRSVISNLAWIT
jgi:hypothetical protein